MQRNSWEKTPGKGTLIKLIPEKRTTGKGTPWKETPGK